MSVDVKVHLWREHDAEIRCREERTMGGIVVNLGDCCCVFLSPAQAIRLRTMLRDTLYNVSPPIAPEVRELAATVEP